MAKLTPEQRERGRLFRDVATAFVQQLNEEQPADYAAPNFLAIFRHNCPKRQLRSTALQLKEVYLDSAEPLSVVVAPDPAPDEVVLEWPGDDGTFAYIYREGKCKGCGQTARSPVGRLALAVDRPPLAGKVTRSGARVKPTDRAAATASE